MIATLRSDAAKLLTDGRAKLVIGYQARGQHRAPVFISDPAKVSALVYDDLCKQNLSVYLRKPEVRVRGPVAIVAPPAAMRSIMVLASETQLSEATVLAVGNGSYHGVLDLAGAATLLKEKYADLAPPKELFEQLAKLGAMSPEERSRFWTEQFAKCTRCYACRAACPGCYCTRCIVEKNVPQWVSTAAAQHGNYEWHIIRAFHQAGRCTLCGACEAACPQGIPLMLLNLSISEEISKQYGEKAGYDPAAKPVIGSWKPNDAEEFIR
ncbi:MAG: 4Fe-4S dicluster domain-containing protein [Planctomycetota bacterium]|nr:4Fe-4S dicluster domain-containing protein [Planctomycetota bacterium]